MNEKFLLINALDKETYADCHIVGSINVPLADLAQAAEQFDKDAEIVVYCASNECPVGAKAWHILHNLGFTNVREFPGGMREWYTHSLPVEGACNATYLQGSGSPLPEDDEIETVTLQDLKSKLGI